MGGGKGKVLSRDRCRGGAVSCVPFLDLAPGGRGVVFGGRSEGVGYHPPPPPRSETHLLPGLTTRKGGVSQVMEQKGEGGGRGFESGIRAGLRERGVFLGVYQGEGGEGVACARETHASETKRAR